MDMSLSELQEMVMSREAWYAVIHGVTKRLFSSSSLSAMKYYPAIKRNAFESVLMRWMTLEPIIQNEVSQKENNKYLILTHIYII